MESPDDVDSAVWHDIRAEARWDAFVLWVMVVAGVLQMASVDAWPYFAIFGGGSFVYFAGRGIMARVLMRREGVRIGNDRSVAVGITFLSLWGLLGLASTAVAIARLEG